MKKSILLLTSLLFITHCGQTPAPTNEVTTDSPYAETLAVLDAGGVSYQLMDGAYEWKSIEPMVEFFSSMILMGIKEGSPELLSPRAVSSLKGLPERVGLNEMLVRGSSTIERPEGGYRSKYVIQKRADAEGWIWDLSGEQIDMAKRIRQFPDTTVLLSHYAFNAPLLQQEIKKELAVFPQALDALDLGEAMLAKMNLPLDALIHSIQQGISFGITLNDQATWQLPVPDLSFSIPETGLVAMLPDAHGEIMNYLVKQIQENMPIPLLMIDAEVEGITVKTLPIPVPVSTAVSLQMVNIEGVTLIATSQNLMQQLIQRREGNTDAPLLESLKSVENTQASFALIGDPKIGKLFAESFKQILSLVEDENAEAMMGPMIDYYKSIFFSIPQVTLNRNEGNLNISVMIHQNPMSPQYTGTSAMTIPMTGGLLAAIALPGFQKARTEAQSKSCINNLRLFEAAKDQFAIENGLARGAAVTEANVSEYLRGGLLPECPQGGTYTLGPIDTLPSCSIHGSLD
ncbi:hypothetical protein P0Y35_04350 [Kiritimatiellaeota bacterium B1221]|nr:hypothetical protein [Kiritimatiellaeota bacterium B1221]